MDSFFLMGAKPLVQDSPSMKLHELLDWHSRECQNFCVRGGRVIFRDC